MTPEVNIIAIAVAALVPNVVGAIYYGPLLGSTWRTAIGKSEADLKPKSEALVYGGALLLSALVAFFLNFMIGMSHKDIGASGELVFVSPRTFGHGAFHGMAIGLMMISPIVACLGLFHGYKGKAIIINVVYWVICLAVMGGIVDMWP